MKIDWVEIPTGEFLMGLSQQQAGMLQSKMPRGQPFQDRTDLANELTQRVVHLDTFWISRTPITYSQMNEFVASGHPYADPWKLRQMPGFRDYPMDHPEPVLWQEAYAFCAWMNARLPTAAEWEKAARGTEGILYPWGNHWDDTRAEFDAITEPNGDVREFSHAVGLSSETASPYGVYDVVGNAREWTATFEYDPRTKLEVPVVKGTCARKEGSPAWLVYRVTRHRAGSLIAVDAPPYTGFRLVLDTWQRQLWNGAGSKTDG